MTIETLADTLHQLCVDDGSTKFVDDILKAARAAIAEGKGTMAALQATGANGKNFTRHINFSPIEVVRACQLALGRYAGDGTSDDELSSTVADFRTLSR